MKKSVLVVAVLLAAGASQVRAQCLSFRVVIGRPPPVFVAPQRVVVVTPPVYVTPPPVVVTPAPVYVSAPAVVVAPLPV